MRIARTLGSSVTTRREDDLLDFEGRIEDEQNRANAELFDVTTMLWRPSLHYTEVKDAALHSRTAHATISRKDSFL